MRCWSVSDPAALQVLEAALKIVRARCWAGVRGSRGTTYERERCRPSRTLLSFAFRGVIGGRLSSRYNDTSFVTFPGKDKV